MLGPNFGQFRSLQPDIPGARTFIFLDAAVLFYRDPVREGQGMELWYYIFHTFLLII